MSVVCPWPRLRRLSTEQLPSRFQLYAGGGLIRHQYLVATDTTHLEPDGTWSYAADISGTKSVMDDAGRISHVAESATMHTSAEVVNHGKAATSVTVKATITDGVTGASVGTSTSASVSIPPCSNSGPCVTVMVNSSAAIKNAKLWSVKSPSLYTVTADVVDGSGKVLDTINYSVGVRTMVYSNKGLTLNNEPVKVRGFCDHSNFAGVGGAVPDRVNLYRVQMLRSVGGNAWCAQQTSSTQLHSTRATTGSLHLLER
jgi:beta-galactosidase/beta-glucuronidase